MSNIHGIGEFRNNPGPPPNGQQQAGYNYDYGGPKGVSMMMPEPHLDGSMPSCAERWFPHTAWYRATTVIIFVDIIMFIATLIVGGSKYDGAFVSSNSMGGPSTTTLYEMGGKWEPVIRKDGEVWRLLTAIVLHAGILHIVSNLFFTVRFGYTTELRWGWPRMVLIYLLTGISGGLWSCVLSYKAVSVGASGALFGLIGADVSYLLYNWAEIPHNSNEACSLAMVIIITFLFGIDTTVDNFAHLGGIISGLFAGAWIPVTLVKRDINIEYAWRIGGLVGFWGLFLLFCLLLWKGDPYPPYD